MAEGRWLADLFSEPAVDRGRTAHERDPDRRRLDSLQALGHELGLPLVAAGDVHMHVAVVARCRTC